MATDKINSSQRPFRIKKSLRDLLHKPHHLKAKRYSLQLPSLPQHDTKTDEYVYDILYECQRG